MSKKSEKDAEEEGVRWVSKQSNLQYYIKPTDLIREVELRPALYTPDHHDRLLIPDFKNALWKEIAQQLMKNWDEQSKVEQSETVIELQKKWRNIKDCFRKELRLRKYKADGYPITKRRYIYFNKLLFLKPIIEDQVSAIFKNKRIITALKKKGRTNKTPKKEQESIDEHEVYDPSNEPVQINTNEYSNVAAAVANNSCINNTNSNCMISDDGMIDEDKTFLLSLVPTFKRMNTDQKLTAKVEILNVLRNIQSVQYFTNANVLENPLHTDASETECFQQKSGRKRKKRMKVELEPVDSDGES